MSLADLLPSPSIIPVMIQRRRLRLGFRAIYRKYRAYTLIHEAKYVDNLDLCASFGTVRGCVVECGVWRGGMSAGMADVLGGDRQYFLFDSFEGMPPASEELDGTSAVAWQSNTTGPIYRNNNIAPQEEAEAAMKLSAATSYSLVKGWFNETTPQFKPPSRNRGAAARWRLVRFHKSLPRESVSVIVTPGGIVIIDDYYNWDGCARAVNEFVAAIAIAQLGPTASPVP